MFFSFRNILTLFFKPIRLSKVVRYKSAAGTRRAKTSLVGPLKVLTSGTYRGPSGESQGTNTKMKKKKNEKIVFQKQQSLLYISIPVFYRKNKYSNVLNGGVHGTSTGTSCRTSREPNDGTFQGRPRDVGQTCFLSSTHKHIKLTLTGYFIQQQKIQ